MDTKWLNTLKGMLNMEHIGEKDGELAFLLGASETYCLDTVNESAESMRARGGGDYPGMFCLAAVMLAKHWYETGGTMVGGTLRENPAGVRMLLNMLKEETP